MHPDPAPDPRSPASSAADSTAAPVAPGDSPPPAAAAQAGTTPHTIWMPLAAAGVAALALLGAFSSSRSGGASTHAQARHQAREEIRHCWAQQRQPALTPDTARSVAGMCEQAEADFTRRFGHRP